VRVRKINECRVDAEPSRDTPLKRCTRLSIYDQCACLRCSIIVYECRLCFLSSESAPIASCT
jgi:hypothetical protein